MQFYGLRVSSLLRCSVHRGAFQSLATHSDEFIRWSVIKWWMMVQWTLLGFPCTAARSDGVVDHREWIVIDAEGGVT